MKVAKYSFINGNTTVKRNTLVADDDPRIALCPPAWRDAEQVVEQATARPGEVRATKTAAKQAATRKG